MKRSEVYPSRWLKATDLPADGEVVTIRKVVTEAIGEQQENKPVMSFDDLDGELVVNRTNWDSIVTITGESDSDNWPGCQIKLVRTKVPFGGKNVEAIRIEAPERVKRALRRNAAPAMSKKDMIEFGSPY